MANTAWNTIYTDKHANYSYYNLDEPHEDMSLVVEILKEHAVHRVLDLGCGAGRNALFLTKQGFAISGIDTAHTGLEQAEQMAKNKKVTLQLLEADIYAPLPFASGSFDAIIAVQSIQHNTRKNIQYCLSECARVLAPHGLIFITVCGRYSLGKVRHCLVKTAQKIDDHTYVPTLGEEQGTIHYIYTKKTLFQDLKDFTVLRSWKDRRDYYSVIAQKNY